MLPCSKCADHISLRSEKIAKAVDDGRRDVLPFEYGGEIAKASNNIAKAKSMRAKAEGEVVEAMKNFPPLSGLSAAPMETAKQRFPPIPHTNWPRRISMRREKSFKPRRTSSIIRDVVKTLNEEKRQFESLRVQLDRHSETTIIRLRRGVVLDNDIKRNLDRIASVVSACENASIQ